MHVRKQVGQPEFRGIETPACWNNFCFLRKQDCGVLGLKWCGVSLHFRSGEIWHKVTRCPVLPQTGCALCPCTEPRRNAAEWKHFRSPWQLGELSAGPGRLLIICLLPPCQRPTWYLWSECSDPGPPHNKGKQPLLGVELSAKQLPTRYEAEQSINSTGWSHLMFFFCLFFWQNQKVKRQKTVFKCAFCCLRALLWI